MIRKALSDMSPRDPTNTLSDSLEDPPDFQIGWVLLMILAVLHAAHDRLRQFRGATDARRSLPTVKPFDSL